MKVPAFDLTRQLHVLQPALREAVERVMASGQFILGEEVAAFERTVGEAWGVSAIGVASGSDALYLALAALGIGPGDEVITTPFTFFATAGSIMRTGAKPVFSDIELDTFNMDPVMASTLVTPRTRAMLPVHLFGLMADVPALQDRYSGPIIEDAAQAIGARWGPLRAGCAGLLGCFSFFPTKNLGALGDGGLVTTTSAELAERVRRLRAHGASRKYWHEEVGMNSRLDALQAAILRAKWMYLDEWTQRRQQLARFYTQLFRDRGIDEVVLPSVPAPAFHVFHQYTVRVPWRDRLREFLGAQGIGTTVYYPVPLHLQPALSALGYRAGQLPRAEEASQSVLSLPMFPELTEAEVAHVVDTIGRFYGHGGQP